jgi:tRNA wybutosine-synthesizing protein 3
MERFEQRKQDSLLKKDKSSIGEWDMKIMSLCNKINKNRNYYTTSSCSGRILLMIDQEKKAKGLFKFITHKKITLKKLIKKIEENEDQENLKLKQEPCILHIACKDLDDANNLLVKAQRSGWKKSGIIALNKNIILEINSTEKIEFPIISNKKLLINPKKNLDFFFKVKETANANLEKGWRRIKELEKNL